MTNLVLASASPARLATLKSAGFSPHVEVSIVDEDRLLAAAGEVSPAEAVTLLAQAKAEEVARRVDPDALVLGCDSMLAFDGKILGKPHDAATARARWQHMRGREAVLHTGHCLLDNRRDGSGVGVTEPSKALVKFARLSDAEIDAYVASGEPLNVAGAFTIDGLGGPFIEEIAGDPHGIVGVSLPLLRRMLSDCDVNVFDLWHRPGFVDTPQPTEP